MVTFVSVTMRSGPRTKRDFVAEVAKFTDRIRAGGAMCRARMLFPPLNPCTAREFWIMFWELSKLPNFARMHVVGVSTRLMQCVRQRQGTIYGSRDQNNTMLAIMPPRVHRPEFMVVRVRSSLESDSESDNGSVSSYDTDVSLADSVVGP